MGHGARIPPLFLNGGHGGTNGAVELGRILNEIKNTSDIAQLSAVSVQFKLFSLVFTVTNKFDNNLAHSVFLALKI